MKKEKINLTKCPEEMIKQWNEVRKASAILKRKEGRIVCVNKKRYVQRYE